MTVRKNQVFERALGPDIFEVAYKIAASGHPFAEQRQLLAVALRDHTTEQEANDKTKKLLTRVWVNPPPEALPLIQWAVAHPEQFTDRRVMHLGALMATFPFVGSVAAVIGKAFAIDGQLRNTDLKTRIVGRVRRGQNGWTAAQVWPGRRGRFEADASWSGLGGLRTSRSLARACADPNAPTRNHGCNHGR